MKYGFKAYAKRLALDVRAEFDQDAFGPFDPYELAATYGIDVDPISELALDDDARHHLSRASQKFSGALLQVGRGFRIVENDLHARTRRRVTVGHEMSHVLLDHEHPAVVRYDRCNGAGKEQEEEATWLAGELLVPYDAALQEAWSGSSDFQVAERFEVSVAEARFRMDASGVRKFVARSRAKRNRPRGGPARD